MAGRIRLSFHTRVFLSVLALCWVLVATFMVFQYRREKEFKASLLNAELQMVNTRVLEDMEDGVPVSCPDSLRLTVIDGSGNVLVDNNDRTPFPATNHNSRPEVAAARAFGEGFSVARHSESDDTDYFYSATLGDDGIVVRTAAPYTHSLRGFLRADGTLLWVMAGMTLTMSLVAYFVTRSISKSITRLTDFADRARRGEPIFNEEAFPDDELGNIASNIVRLYVERDARHRQALTEQQEKDRLKKELTSNINHELKTPAASMLVCAELLRAHPDLPEEKRAELLDRLEANGRRLDALLRDVAMITRLDEGGDVIGREPVDLADVAREVAAECRMRTAMEIRLDIPSSLMVMGNRPLLESVFRNLIENAIVHSGGTMISIRMDDDGAVEVSDNGRGVPSEHLPRIFERFYRVDKGRSRAAGGGTGLGLSIVRNAIAVHGGCVTAVDSPGLTFRFNIPPMRNFPGEE
ncbi:MAG: HAMP domain-containing histidine kinase [Muribaculaceae bacterium]|nr:HAMP domain-containing histidine kinase [Muribaculaceae bacterium]